MTGVFLHVKLNLAKQTAFETILHSLIRFIYYELHNRPCVLEKLLILRISNPDCLHTEALYLVAESAVHYDRQQPCESDL